MTFASPVPTISVSAIINLDDLPYEIVRRPADARLAAWAKAEECERRWTMFDWVCVSVGRERGSQALFDDFASAYLLTFEATIQIVLEDLKQINAVPDRFTWLNALPELDLTCRGLRTLRILEAHIRTTPLQRGRGLAHSRLVGGVTPPDFPATYFPELSVADLRRMDHPKVSAVELPGWNAIVRTTPAYDLMRQGLERIARIVEAAEALPAVP